MNEILVLVARDALGKRIKGLEQSCKRLASSLLLSVVASSE